MKTTFRDAMRSLEGEHWWYRARRRILDRAVEQFVGKTGRGLTVGVGAREEAELLGKWTELVAIDMAELDPSFNELSHTAQADATELPFHPSSFDVVFLFDVLEHIPDDAAAINEFRRVLKSSGKLLITVPAFMFMYGLQDEVSGHQRRYSRKSLAAQLVKGGFEVSYLGYFNTVLFPPIATVRLLRRLIPTKPNGQGGDFDLRLPPFAERSLETLFSMERHAIPNWELPIGVSLMCLAEPMG